MGEKKCKNLNDGYGRINREFFFFSFFSVVVVKTIRTRRSYSILSGTGKPGARLGQRITESDGSKRERERVVGGVKNAKGVERCYREGLENCSSVGKSPTCSSQIFTSISVRLELNLE